MKLILKEVEDIREIEAEIRYPVMNQEVERLMAAIRSCSLHVKGEKDGCSYQLAIEKILYIESVDEHTYLYSEDCVYASHRKLYELEQFLKHTTFVRISKSCIVNTRCLIHVKPLFDGKLIATMMNKEELVVNRHYVKGFKEVFGL